VIAKSEVVERLTEAFRRHGYDGASLARLSEVTGLGRSSLYHHFPGGKAEMACAVMERADEWLQKSVVDVLQGPGTPLERLASMLHNLDEFYSSGRASCLLGIMTIGDGRDVVSNHVRNALERWIGALASLLKDARVKSPDAQRRAEDAVMRIQGAIVLARGLDDPQPFRRLMDRLPQEIFSEPLPTG
jgi:AcrR family transcriptional regulator